MFPNQQRNIRPPVTHPVTVVGRRRIPLRTVLGEASDLNQTERAIAFDCTSGRRISAVWTGFPTIPLIEPAGIPRETTHLKIESTGDHTGCVSLYTAMDGLLAFERDGERLDGFRFVAPDIHGPRAVKNVGRIETIALEPGDDRARYEQFQIRSKDPE